VLRLAACAAYAMVDVVWKAAVIRSPYLCVCVGRFACAVGGCVVCRAVQLDDIGKAGIDY
jgi:hypothetical protein